MMTNIFVTAVIIMICYSSLYMTGSCIPNCYFRMSCCYFCTLYLVNILISDLTHVWSYDRKGPRSTFSCLHVEPNS